MSLLALRPAPWLLATLAFAASCRGPTVPFVESERAIRDEPVTKPEPATVRLDKARVGGAVPMDFGSAFRVPSEDVAESDPAADAGDSVIATVDGVEVRKHHVFDRLREVDPQRMREIVEMLMLDARVRRLVAQHSVFVPDSDLQLAVKREWARVERAFRQRPGGAKDIAAYLGANYGMDEKGFRERVQLLAWRRLLRAYSLRYEVLRRGGASVLYFFHPDRQNAERARARIAAGADFSVIARTDSRDRSAKTGGRLPFLPSDFKHPALELAAGVELGAVSPVGRVTTRRGKEGWGFVRVRERRAPDRRPYREVVAELRRELASRPVDASELALYLLAR